jgi:peptide/nickel transport system substrate-binding protein
LTEHRETDITRRSLLRWSVTAGGALLVPGVLSACGGDGSGAAKTGGTPATGAARTGGRLRVGHVGSGSAESLDPMKQYSFIDSARALNLYDGLTAPTPDGQIAYRLAESMEPNADATVWNVKLRSGVTFHDGSEMTADDVLFTFQRIVDEKLTAAALIDPVDLKRTRKRGKHEIELVLTRGVAELPSVLSTHLLVITKQGAKTFEKPIGTGPFKFQSFAAGERSLFVKNPDYWVEGRPYVDELEQISIPDDTARLNALKSGEVDLLEFLSFSQAKVLQDSAAISLVVAKGNNTTPMYMRIDSKPLDDVRVRTALKLAIDREKIVENALLGFGEVSNDVFGQGAPGYSDSLEQRTYDPEQARSLLKQAGQEDLTVELITSTAGPGMLEAATAYAEQAKAAGITIKLNKVPAADLFNTDLYYLKAPFGQTQWSHKPWQEHVLQGLVANAPYNETHWVKPGFDKAYYRAVAILDEQERFAAYADLEQQQWSEGGYLIWGVQDLIDAASSRVQGITPSPNYNLGRYDFKEYWLA